MDAESMPDIFRNAINLEGHVIANNAEGVDGAIKLVSEGADISLNGLIEADTGAITVRAGEGGVYNEGTISAELFDEKGYTFVNTGTMEGGAALYDNLDGAAFISGNIGMDQYDTGDLTVNGNITLTDDVVFGADSNNDGTVDSVAPGVGAFSMNVGTSITGAGYDLKILSGEDATLRSITGVDLFTIGSTTATGRTFTSDAAENFSVTTFKTLGDGTTTFARDKMNGSAKLIYDITQFQAVNNDITADYELANNIDAADTATWNAGAGFDPIAGGGNGPPELNYTGTFDGTGHYVKNLYINRPGESFVGLFGSIDGNVQNIGVINGNVTWE